MAKLDVSDRQGSEFQRLRNDKGLTVAKCQRELFDNGRIADLMEACKRGTLPKERNIFREELGLGLLYPKPKITELGIFEIDYTKSIEELLEMGDYDYAEKYITSQNFPARRKGVVKSDLAVVYFNRDDGMFTKEVLKGLDELNLEPTDAHELLTVGAKKRSLHRRSRCIVELLQSCKPPYGDFGGEMSLTSQDGRQRAVGLEIFRFETGVAWSWDTRFLARHKRKR